MKYLPLLLVVALFMSCNTQSSAPQDYTEIPWLTIDEAQKQTNKTPRKIIVDVYTPWCGPCKMMMSKTFTDPTLINYISNNYYAVKFNGESGDPINFDGKEYTNPNFNAKLPKNRRNSTHQFTQSLGLRGYPTLYIFDPQLNKVSNIVGFKSADQLMEILKGLES